MKNYKRFNKRLSKLRVSQINGNKNYYSATSSLFKVLLVLFLVSSLIALLVLFGSAGM